MVAPTVNFEKTDIEKAYATHYIDSVQIMALKEGQKQDYKSIEAL